MKLDLLRKIIREEVRGSIREELKELLIEAVEIASRPVIQPEHKPQVPKEHKSSYSPVTSILERTKKEMTGETFRNMMESNEILSESNTEIKDLPVKGADLSKIPGLNKAKAILDKAIAKKQT